MKYAEKLLWILDSPGGRLKNENEYQINIDFVHSLGLKCDCVGWSKLDLADPRTREILDAITQFCHETGWTGRCLYNREFTDVESEWYELAAADFQDATCSNRMILTAEDGSQLHYWTIAAYHETTAAPKRLGDALYVPERFRNACIRNGIEGLNFCWAKDKGRYAAEQYFQMFGKLPIPRIAIDFQLNNADFDRIQAAGGWLPRIAEVFPTLQQVNLPDCYLAADLPAGGIAYGYIPRTNSFCGRYKVLIHKDTAEVLLREKALSAGALRPAPVVDALPGGYVMKETSPIPRPTADFTARMLAEYEKLNASPRPVRMIPEKDALKVLRKAKKDRKADFQKAIPKAKLPALEGTEYAPLAPYYGISNGGFLSDEYELLPLEQTEYANEEFHAQLQAEELLESKPDGVVIAGCPDGDHSLLYRDGSVIRFSHEVPEITGQWPTLAQFIFDAVTENE